MTTKPTLATVFADVAKADAQAASRADAVLSVIRGLFLCFDILIDNPVLAGAKSAYALHKRGSAEQEPGVKNEE